MLSKKNIQNKRILGCIVAALIISAISMRILPMMLMRGNYILGINDELDSYAGNVQRIHDLKSFFDMNKGQSFMGGLNNHYSIMSPLDLYTIFCCLLGYLDGQICIRIFSVLVGFFSMQLLLREIYNERSYEQSCLLTFISCVYAVTSSAPNRQIAFATLPLILWFFIFLKKQKKITPFVLLIALYPMVTNFNAIFVFVMAFWACLTFIDMLIKKGLNKNLLISFLIMGVSAVLVFKNSLWLALVADDTNRILFSETVEEASFDWERFRNYLFYGQYHSTAQHGTILLPVLLVCSILFFLVYVINREFRAENRMASRVLGLGWCLWVMSAFIETFQESGFDVGITLIDGFQWGRIIGFMRLAWYLMVATLILIKPLKKEKFWHGLLGILIGILVIQVIKEVGFKINTCLDDSINKYIMVFIYVLTLGSGALLLYSKRIYFRICIYFVLFFQIFILSTSKNQYNDFGINVIRSEEYSESIMISYNEFFSESLFDEIKRDINYNYDEEWVAAYGFHPSVLMYNGFNTLDRYESCHSMRDQEEFREIIAPALDMYPEYATYYDEWGGRMYLFGSLNYEPTRKKCNPDEQYPLYIDVEQFKKYKGKYILSRASISNAEEIGLEFVNDYDAEESLYHIYLYQVR